MKANISQFAAIALAGSATAKVRDGISFHVPFPSESTELAAGTTYFESSGDDAWPSTPLILEAPVDGISESQILYIEAGASVPIHFNEWCNEAESRFDILAVKEALETITDEELIELEDLQRLRSSEFAPRSYEEIKRERDLDALTEAAMEAIDNLLSYAKKHYPTTPS